jgi:hypothetical protein
MIVSLSSITAALIPFVGMPAEFGHAVWIKRDLVISTEKTNH